MSELSKSPLFRGQEQFQRVNFNKNVVEFRFKSYFVTYNEVMKRHPSLDRGYERHGEA